ncbi:uncharacterized protein LOC129591094 [Paramacrobiotus metropolitanus]|uniref:uncharacterized protein LOC129591094 n=1 Tax=Paramacrobiotus metropolitanus TaxID=2943436 RepID=UPI0024458F33|nr:uncharacterized protein LOC129591094 [Paramacrobiotus metropolitanus]
MLLAILTFCFFAVAQLGHCQWTQDDLIIDLERRAEEAAKERGIRVEELPGIYRHSNGHSYCGRFKGVEEFDRVRELGQCLQTVFGFHSADQPQLLVSRNQRLCMQKVSFGSEDDMITTAMDSMYASKWLTLHPVDQQLFDTAMISIKDCRDKTGGCADCVNQTRLADLIAESHAGRTKRYSIRDGPHHIQHGHDDQIVRA